MTFYFINKIKVLIALQNCRAEHINTEHDGLITVKGACVYIGSDESGLVSNGGNGTNNASCPEPIDSEVWSVFDFLPGRNDPVRLDSSGCDIDFHLVQWNIFELRLCTKFET